MSCRRCKGLVVKTYGLDVGGTCEPVMIELWRCVQCGDIFDEQILKNHRKREAESLEGLWHSESRIKFPIPVHNLPES